MRNFFTQLKYSIIMSIKDGQFLFWMTVFPILLCSAFYLAFNDIDKLDNLNIQFGINQDNVLEGILNQVPIIEITKADDKELKAKLLDKKIDVYLDSNYELVIMVSNIKSEISLDVLKKIKQYALAYTIKANNDYNLGLNNRDILRFSLKELAPYIEKGIKSKAFVAKEFIQKKNQNIEYKNTESSVLKIILFTCFSMFSLYGIYISLHFMEMIEADLSPVAIRIASSPYKKSKMIVVTFTASLLMNFVFNILLMFFVSYVLDVNLFTKLKLSLIILFFAGIFGNSLGILFSLVKGLTRAQKSGLTNMVLLILSFICGMGGNTDLQRIIERTYPILNRINPINLINEALYQANIIGNWSIVPRNLSLLLIGSIFLLVISGVILRRKNYDSV